MIIKNGTIYDAVNKDGYVADILIKDGKINEIRKNIKKAYKFANFFQKSKK